MQIATPFGALLMHWFLAPDPQRESKNMCTVKKDSVEGTIVGWNGAERKKGAERCTE